MSIVKIPTPRELGITPNFESYQDNPKDEQMRYFINLSQSERDRYFNFNRYQMVFNDYELSSLFSYVFIVRPSLNLVKNDGAALSQAVENIPFFNYMLREHKYALLSLSSSLSNEHDFVPFLFERTESYQISDVSLKHFEYPLSYTAMKAIYGGTATESKSGVQFDITFREDSGLNVTMFFYAWIQYIDMVGRGIISPDRKCIYEKKLDYTCSIYNIVCGPNGKKILFFGKVVGGIPLNAPFSNFSKENGNTPNGKVQISFIAPHYDPLNPAIMKEFNMNSASGNVDYVLPYYDGNSPTIVGNPYINYDTSTGYELRWREKI